MNNATTTKEKCNDNIPVNAQHTDAFERFVAAIAPDMPLLMHGAGDVVLPVDSESAALLARYTAEFVSKLTTAAVDAHEILTDGADLLAPPSFPHKTVTPMSYAEEVKLKNEYATSDSKSENIFKKGKRKIPGEEYWDDPLPPIKVKKKKDNNNKTKDPNTQQEEIEDAAAPSAWMGCQGVDLQRDLRSRKRHVQQAIGTRSFTFPICHDAELYERVSHLQATKEEVQEVLEDNTIMDFIKAEAKSAKGILEDSADDGAAEEESSAVEW
eukprot:CAMPEP_0178901820 /NCGR_PEP_ID=MMETSP0786-20121207/4254_1 /TAXON_ID=186022 /ORGANISM="Thalassionema frauenfeldii, Strain CCMP 1798" /LENGTH=268 /DNA_ID=CAMNT_0020573003 /DNA_START=107 /DNA_END=910 /DNA_ORIENTATION=+